MDVRRARTVPTGPFWSKYSPVLGILAACSDCSTLPIIDASTLTVALALEICTAGDSPKKFGKV
ncbi:Uncharacterised protein [Mycobacteroides abscessus subsp. abscessus]|nr:Uncharacterised protein [Mycobacteroides abscessus subsp. abscessus]